MTEINVTITINAFCESVYWGNETIKVKVRIGRIQRMKKRCLLKLK